MDSLNDTTWDWWYFDAVSPDFDYSIVVVFFTATSESLWPGTTDVGSADYMVVTLTLPDGTTLEAGVVGKEVTVVTVENGSSGIVVNTSSGWVGTPDMKTYTISIDAPEEQREHLTSVEIMLELSSWHLLNWLHILCAMTIEKAV